MKAKIEVKKNKVSPTFPTTSQQPNGGKKKPPRSQITRITCLKSKESSNWLLAETLEGNREMKKNRVSRGFEGRKKNRKGGEIRRLGEDQ